MVLFPCSNAGEVGEWGANRALTLRTQAGSLPELLLFILSLRVYVHVCGMYVCDMCVHFWCDSSLFVYLECMCVV